MKVSKIIKDMPPPFRPKLHLNSLKPGHAVIVQAEPHECLWSISRIVRNMVAAHAYRTKQKFTVRHRDNSLTIWRLA